VPYKTIIAYFPDTDAAPSIIDAARVVSIAHGAHLIGLYAIPAMRVHFSGAAYYDAGMVVELIEKHRARHKDQAKKLHALFQEQMPDTVPSHEWMQIETPTSSPVSRIAAIANAADLIILPNATGDPSIEPEDYAIAEKLLLEIGRPALMVPSGWRGTELGENVTIAFDGTPQAARAVWGGLALIQSASRVDVIEIDGTTGDGDAAQAANAQLCDSLKRHGIPASSVDLASGDASIAETIRRHLRAQDSDCLIMGAYGHSRLREIMLGGATRDMLSVMPVPVLMAH
jgi:nucleotide-binding universal stress UspA family protein